MFTVNIKPVKLTIDRMLDTLVDTGPVLQEVGLFAKQLIAQKPARGVDWNGFKFKDSNSPKILFVENRDTFLSISKVCYVLDNPPFKCVYYGQGFNFTSSRIFLKII